MPAPSIENLQSFRRMVSNSLLHKSATPITERADVKVMVASKFLEITAALENLNGLQLHVERNLGNWPPCTSSGSSYDVAFVDISGIHTASQTSTATLASALILIGSDETYAREAIDLGAVDFLMPGDSPTRIEQALYRAMASLNVASMSGTADVSGLTRPAACWVRARRKQDVLVFPLTEVLYFQADGKYSRVVTAKESAYLTSGINHVARQLNPHEFWRIHRSTIVNAAHVLAIRRDDMGRVWIELRDISQKLLVARSCEPCIFQVGFL